MCVFGENIQSISAAVGKKMRFILIEVVDDSKEIAKIDDIPPI